MSDGLSGQSRTANRAAWQFAALGYACASDEDIGPDGKQAEREAYDEVAPKRRFKNAVAR